MRHGCLIEKSRPRPSRQIWIGPKEFSLVIFLTRACGARPSGRLRRSRRTRRSATKKVTRAPARKRFRALPDLHDPPVSRARQTNRAIEGWSYGTADNAVAQASEAHPGFARRILKFVPGALRLPGLRNCILPTKEQRLDAWLNPNQNDLNALNAVLDDRDYKPINKAGEIIAKTLASSHVDELFAKRCYRLYDIMERLSSELKAMAKKMWIFLSHLMMP
jgi:hypothetical protein